MKKIILLLIATLLFTSTTITIAAEKSVPKTQKPVAAKSQDHAIKDTVILYDAPNVHAKIIKTLSANANIIGIFRQGDWMKVGDRQDGTIGWINVPQYQKARNHFYDANFQTDMSSVVINVSKDKNGKTVFEAYKNGKKLSESDAKKLYDNIQAREKKQSEAMQHFNQMMNQQILMEQREMNQLFQDQPLFVPGVVIIEKNDSKK